MVAIKGVVAVQNHATSGSTLMQSLLDDHPQILSLPCLHGHTLYHFWKNHGQLPASQLLEAFIKEYAYWGDPSLVPDTLGLQEMGENRDQPTKIDMSAFTQQLKTLGWDAAQPLTRKDYIQGIYIAYAKALGRTLNQENYWVVFPIHGHGLEIAQWLTQDFDTSYFLHTTRNPVQNMGSGAKHILPEAHFGHVYLLHANSQQVFLENAVHIRERGLRGFHYYMPDSGDGKIQSRAIRLEDLHKDSDATMRAIASWMQIPWDAALLRSTYDGKLWNNRPTSIRQSGLGKGTIQQKHAEIFNEFDRWRLHNAGKHLVSFYHYMEDKDFAPEWVRRFVLPLALLLPFKVEWSYPHALRAYPSIVAKCNWLLGMQDLPQKVMRRLAPGIYARISARPAGQKVLNVVFSISKLFKYFVKIYAAIMAVVQMLLGYIVARIGLLRIWSQSFTPAISSLYVPLLHYKDMQTTNNAAETKSTIAA